MDALIKLAIEAVTTLVKGLKVALADDPPELDLEGTHNLLDALDSDLLFLRSEMGRLKRAREDTQP